MGQAPAGKDCNKEGIGTPFVKAGEFGESRPIIREWTTDPKKHAKETDVLICVVGATCGKINLGAKCAIGRSAAAIRPNSQDLDQFYLHYYLQGTVEQLRGGSVGAAQTVISKQMLADLPIPLPPLEEQKRIVAKLDQAFTALDRARAYAEANLADAGELFDSWLQTSFETGSGDWPSKTLSQVCENLDRSRVPITKKDRKSGNVPYYGASGVVDHVADHIFDDDLLLISEDGANLLARTYPIAFSISGKSWVNNHAHVLKFENLDSQEFVRLYMNSISLEPFVSGMAQPKLNQKELNRIPIPFPNIQTQRIIVSKASEVWAKSQEAKAHYEAQLTDLADLRQSLLQKAFSGQL